MIHESVWRVILNYILSMRRLYDDVKMQMTKEDLSLIIVK